MNESPTIILAYVDPGAAGFIVVSVLGFFAAIGYTIRSHFARLKALVFRSARNGSEDTPRRTSRRR